MVVCDNCFDPDCARSLNSAVVCSCVEIPSNIVRDDLSSGITYGGVIAALPQASTGVTVSLIDSLRRHQPQGATVPALSTAANTLYNGGADVAGSPWYTVVDGRAHYAISRFEEYIRQQYAGSVNLARFTS